MIVHFATGYRADMIENMPINEALRYAKAFTSFFGLDESKVGNGKNKVIYGKMPRWKR